MLATGFAKRDITPPLGTPCALGLDDEAIEVFDPIFIRALALSDDHHTVLVLSADVIGIYQYADLKLRKQIADRVNIPPDNIVLHATHTHQSPCLRIEYGECLAEHGLRAYSPEFWQSFQEAAVAAGADACADLAPAEVFYGESPVSGIASNRRLRMPDGSIIMRGSRDTEERRAYPEGYIDPLVRVLSFRRDRGEALLINYCCHPSASGGDEGPYITGDFPGYAIMEIERELPVVQGIHLTGPCGNINPGKHTGWRSRKEDAEAMGNLLGQSALAARDSAENVADTVLHFICEEVEVPLREELLSEAEYEAEVLRHIEDYKAAKGRGETPPGGALRNGLCKMICRRHATGDLLQTHVRGLAYGDLLMFFLPGECFLELDHAIRGHYVDRRVICAETCDYTVSYVPVPEAYVPGAQGYEGAIANVGPQAFGILASTACEMF